MSSPPVTLEISKRKNLSVLNLKSPEGDRNVWLLNTSQQVKQTRVFSDDETSGFYEPDAPWRGSDFDQRWYQARNSSEQVSRSSRNLPKSLSNSTHVTHSSSATAYMMSESEADVTDCFRHDDINFDIRRAIENYTMDDTSTLIGVEDRRELVHHHATEQTPAIDTPSASPSSSSSSKPVPWSPGGSAKTGPVLKRYTPSSPVSQHKPVSSSSHSSASSYSNLGLKQNTNVASSTTTTQSQVVKPKTSKPLLKFMSKGTGNSSSSGTSSFRNVFSKTKDLASRRSSYFSSSPQEPTTKPQESSHRRFRSVSQPYSAVSISSDIPSASSEGRRSISAAASPQPRPLPKLNLNLMTDLTTPNGEGISSFHDILDAYLKEEEDLKEPAKPTSMPTAPLNVAKVRRKPIVANTVNEKDKQSALTRVRTMSGASVVSTESDSSDPEEVKVQQKLNKLQAQLSDCEQDIAKCQSALSQLEPFLDPAEFYKYSREERASLKTQEEDTRNKLSALEKKKYEVGILYSKAWKRRRESGASDFWVRSH